MADHAEDRRVEPLALHRIGRRYTAADATRLAAFLEDRIMGTSKIIDALIAAIHEAEARGITRYVLSQRTGIPQSTISRLMNRERESLRVDTVERLCEELGFTLDMRAAKRSSPRSRR